ncbi:MAG: Na(+)/H(+) antiporter subunit C [Leucobacter sp.]
MTMPLVLVIVMVVLYACGVYLMLDRTLTRLLLGFLLVGNATNLLIFLMSGSFGKSPISTEATVEEMSDPLPQAFILTAIVITFGVSAFLLALIYRSWRLTHDRDDTVQDDEADLEISTTEALTTEEVTEEDLEDTPEFDDEQDDDDISPDRDGVGIDVNEAPDSGADTGGNTGGSNTAARGSGGRE